jgi:CRISPR-associated protein Csb2
MTMLAIEIHLLLGRYAAADYRDRERPEWPPHPDRLFSALVAAAYESGLGESARAALLWLEGLPAPHVAADDAPAVQTPLTAFVPINDPKTGFLPPRSERRPRSFPSVVPEVSAAGACPEVCFLWPEVQPDETLTRLLSSITQRVAYLGSSRSPVRVRLKTEALSDPNWVPDDEGDVVLRVPGPGRLESLEWHYQNDLRPPLGALQRYRRGPRMETSRVHEGVFGEMVVYRLTGPSETDIETALKLTSALRATCMRRAQELAGGVPEVLSGHDEQGKSSVRPHAAFVALPFVSEQQQYADGRILGLGVLLPRGLSGDERRRVVRALMDVDRVSLPGGIDFRLARCTPGQPVPHNIRSDTWTRPSRRWASVTPLLLDHFPKKGSRSIAKVIARGCEYIGLPPPADVVPDQFSPLYGVQPSFRFLVRRSASKPRLYTHATLTFAEPVRGPVVVGAGRYFGLGLFRPISEGGE